MDAVQRTHRFRWGRFVALVAVGAVMGLVMVEFFAPEQMFRADFASAEVAWQFRSERPPTAEQVRRRALSTANLSAVYRRLIARDNADLEVDEAGDSAEQFDRWRRQIAVELRTSGDHGRCRIRFLAENADRTADAAIVAEAVAAQYAADVFAERQALRVAELSIADARTEVAPSESPPGFDDEFVELMEARARLLETMQPAHPDVVALDARLNTLRTAVSGSPIRRVSAESDDPKPRDFSAAEIPTVTTRDAVSGPWEQRPFWQVAACFLALCIAWPASRGARSISSEPNETPSRIVAPPRSRTSDPTVVLRRRDRAAPNAP